MARSERSQVRGTVVHRKGSAANSRHTAAIGSSLAKELASQNGLVAPAVITLRPDAPDVHPALSKKPKFSEVLAEEQFNEVSERRMAREWPGAPKHFLTSSTLPNKALYGLLVC